MWEKRENDGITYFTLPKWKDMGAEIFVSTRTGGVSTKGFNSLNLARHVDDDPDAVTENRKRFLAALDIPEKSFVSIQQTHSNHIQLVVSKDRGRGLNLYEDAFPDTDGMFTSEKGVFMATFYADCLPLALFDPEHKVLGLAHAGWRGTYSNIGTTLLKEMMRTFGSRPQDTLFAMGPGIGFCCYEVDTTFYRQFVEKYKDAKNWFTSGRDGKYYFDNAQANISLLSDAGILKENIEKFSYCTCCNQRLFYSYRGSGGNCGRHGLFGQLR